MIYCRSYFNGPKVSPSAFLLPNLQFVTGWSEAIASDHVTLDLPPESEAPYMYPDNPHFLGQCNGSAEDLSGMVSPSDMVFHATNPKSKSRK